MFGIKLGILAIVPGFLSVNRSGDSSHPATLRGFLNVGGICAAPTGLYIVLQRFFPPLAQWATIV